MNICKHGIPLSAPCAICSLPTPEEQKMFRVGDYAITARLDALERERDEWKARALESDADAKMFQWLTSDPDNKEERERKNSLLLRMPVMSYSAASAAIQAAMQEFQT